MNCECFYVVTNENTIENARLLAKTINYVANKQCEEVFPIYISKAKKDFYATADYDNSMPSFKVKEGQFLVFAYGKDYCMNRIRPNGGRRGFPNVAFHDDFYEGFEGYIEDVEKVDVSKYEGDEDEMNGLKKIADHKTETFDVGEGYLMDVITMPSNEMYEAWIYHKDYGIKSLMFGISQNDMTYEEFIETAYCNTDDYISFYEEEYMD